MKLVMDQRQLKSLVESGSYRPEPELIACAMLRRRGVRTLLTGTPLSPADRIPSAVAIRRQAA
jgi:hypothetical protein